MLRHAARQLAACAVSVPGCASPAAPKLVCGPSQPVSLAATYFLRALSSSAASTPVYGACVLERSPVVVPYDPDWETEYQEWRDSLQERYFKQYPQQFLTGQGQQQEESQDSRNQFQPASRITEADEQDDRRSLRRKLDQRLYLLIKQRGADSWQFPRQQHSSGESIRQTIERAIAQVNLGGAQLHFLGNMPHGHLPAPEGSSKNGTTFFMRALLIQGEPVKQASGEVGDYAWVAKEEVPEYVKEPQLLLLMEKFL